jgi:hypothetical protein
MPQDNVGKVRVVERAGILVQRNAVTFVEVMHGHTIQDVETRVRRRPRTLQYAPTRPRPSRLSRA